METIKYNKITFIPEFSTDNLNENNLYALKNPIIEKLDDYTVPKLDFSESNIFMKNLYSMHEIKIYKKLKNLNISPKMIGYGELNNTGVGILVLEKMIPLKNVINKENVYYFVKVFLVKLTKLHELGVIHRDLKMDNLLFNKDDLFICDFEDKGYSEEWAAPEVLEKCEFSIKSDIYSAGCVIYEMITGNTPWHDTDDFEEYVLNKDFNLLLSNINDKKYKTIIENCLLKRLLPNNI